MEPTSSLTHCTIEAMEDWAKAARQLLRAAGSHQVWYFKGPLGAGKTTLIQAVCACLGVKEQVTSPTFSLVHEYQTRGGARIYHFDLYRLDRYQEVISIGLEDYLTSGKHLFIEWPEILEELTMPDPFEIVIEPSSDKRTLRWRPIKQACHPHAH